MNGTFWSESNNDIIFGGRNYVKQIATNKCYQFNTEDPSIILVIGGRDGSKVRKNIFKREWEKMKKII